MSRPTTSSHTSASSVDNSTTTVATNDLKVIAAVGGSLLFSGLAMSYYYGKKLKQQQEDFDNKLQNLILAQQQNQGQNNVLQSNQFSARIAPGPVPTLLLSSPAFQPVSTSATPRTGPTDAATAILQRRNSGASLVQASPRLMPRRSAIVVVDPVSTGANVAHEVTRRGIPCIRVMSGFMSPTLLNLVDESIRTEFVASVNHDSADPYKTVVSLASLPFTIIGILSGSELGVEVTDFLTEQLGVPSNGTEMTNARRDKYQMGEAVRRAGVRAAKQARVQSWSEMEAFLEDLRPNPFKVVLKPIRSAGSDNVYLCESVEETKHKFEQIIGSQNQLGFQNEAVVAQEFLEGKEYVIDGACRDGASKVIAIWEYDKRFFNGFNFVYFGMGSVSGVSPLGASLAAYTTKVVAALNIRHGAFHGEVIMTKTGPCLVEIGARCHGYLYTQSTINSTDSYAETVPMTAVSVTGRICFIAP